MKAASKIAALVLGALLTTTAWAGDDCKRKESVPGTSWNITKRAVDTKLPGSDARIKFTFSHHEKGLSEQTVNIIYNNTQKTVKSNVKGVYSLALKPGKYTFTISQTGCDTLFEKIEIKKQERVDISVNFGPYTPPNAVAEKPVIYLYPDKKMDIQVKVSTPNGFSFTYPEYNQGWNVTANPDGTIETNGKTYSYLFWEGPVNTTTVENKQTGFIVSNETLMTFLESSLTTIGLTTKEQQDFITWWYPKMKENDKNYVRFLVNGECNALSGLQITPAPQTQLRLYMVWMNAGELTANDITTQTLPTIPRNGFTVVEWGGVELQPEAE